MPKSRRSSALPPSRSDVPVRLPDTAKRWALLAMVLAGALAVAWIDGGEEALRPIAQPVDLVEQPQ